MGFEPTTSAVTGQRSKPLNYYPMKGPYSPTNYLGNKASLTPISLWGQAATSSRVRTGLAGRENATMLFAAKSDVRFASVFCSPSRFQSCSLYPVETLASPRNGDEGSRTPVRNVGGTTYSSKEECLQTDLNRRPWLYKSPALPLCYRGWYLLSIYQFAMFE